MGRAFAVRDRRGPLRQQCHGCGGHRYRIRDRQAEQDGNNDSPFWVLCPRCDGVSGCALPGCAEQHGDAIWINRVEGS